jgi:arylsulfatase A-like enzyme
MPNRRLAGLFFLALAATLVATPTAQAARFPDVLLVTIDTLRADRLGAYGYDRPTSPTLDALFARGALFTEARTVEPLTSPASCSILTSRFPHEHGSTRNGLRMRPGLESLPKILARRGYRTTAFVGNWTLKDELSGLGEHFEDYGEVFSRKRWLGMVSSEATGEDLTAELLDWIEAHQETDRPRPYFAWVHYVEPHAPYRFQEDFTERLGLDPARGVSRSDRYDSEVAFVDREISRLLAGIEQRVGSLDDTLIVVTSDHGENLGEHGYWGHGRHLHEEGLAVPLGIVWKSQPSRVRAKSRIDTPALVLDVAPTVLGLLGLPVPDDFRGEDFSGVLAGRGPAPTERLLFFQAHKGAVHGDHASSEARLDGLLEVGSLEGNRKSVLDLRGNRLEIYDLGADPGEHASLTREDSTPGPQLKLWLEAVLAGLRAASDLPVDQLDEESVERLRALGYLD